MTKSLCLTASLLCMAVLIGEGAVPAQAGGTSVPVPAGRPTEFRVLTSPATILATEALCQILRSALGAVNAVESTDSRLGLSASLILATHLSSINSGAVYQNGGNNNNQGGNNNNQGGNNNNQGGNNNNQGGNNNNQGRNNTHNPLPEPSTLLSFAAAVVIGAGVFLLGRLRKERK
jgi:hypothetical protein